VIELSHRKLGRGGTIPYLLHTRVAKVSAKIVYDRTGRRIASRYMRDEAF